MLKTPISSINTPLTETEREGERGRGGRQQMNIKKKNIVREYTHCINCTDSEPERVTLTLRNQLTVKL